MAYLDEAVAPSLLDEEMPDFDHRGRLRSVSIGLMVASAHLSRTMLRDDSLRHRQ